jgi:predicted RNA-binding Zn-ribbon protein involved in translation (DUF1610 family)
MGIFRRLFGSRDLEVPSAKMSGVMKCGVCFGALGAQYVRDERLGIYACRQCIEKVNLSAIAQPEGNLYHCHNCGFRFKMDFGWLGYESKGGGFYGGKNDPSYVPRCPNCGAEYTKDDVL